MYARSPCAHPRGRGGNPLVDVQMNAGHSQSQVTERYIHAAQALFPGAAARRETRLFAMTDGPGPLTS